MTIVTHNVHVPDMYALSPRTCDPRALGIHIRQITRAHVTTITYHTIKDTALLN